MNGVHDMGGMHGMGPIAHDPDEPVFHEVWEGRAWGLQRAMGRWGRGQWGNTRYELERIPPADYLRMSYYERWFTILVNRLLRSNLVTPAELASGIPDSSLPGPEPPPASQSPAQGAAGSTARQNVRLNPVFKPGQRVRGRNRNPEGHTRMPRYTRGRRGTVVRDNGVFNLQDTDVNGRLLGVRPQHVYTVQFTARELWGDQASPRDSVHVDMWEDYLERG
jgi:nitrile hydratase beta subunit